MFAAIMMIVLIWICMWIFYKFMYPRPPKSMMPQDGDVTTPRICNFCGHSLAEYRGVLETNTEAALRTDGVINNANDSINNQNEFFFCNYEHQADFHAGKVYK